MRNAAIPAADSVGQLHLDDRHRYPALRGAHVFGQSGAQLPETHAHGASRRHQPRPSATCRHAAHLSPHCLGFDAKGDQMVQVRQNGQADTKPESVLQHLPQHVLGLQVAQLLLGPDSGACRSGFPCQTLDGDGHGSHAGCPRELLHASLMLAPLLPWQRQSLHAPMAMAPVHVQAWRAATAHRAVVSLPELEKHLGGALQRRHMLRDFYERDWLLGLVGKENPEDEETVCTATTYMGREAGRPQMQQEISSPANIAESAVVPAVRSSASIAGLTRQECPSISCQREPLTRCRV